MTFDCNTLSKNKQIKTDQNRKEDIKLNNIKISKAKFENKSSNDIKVKDKEKEDNENNTEKEDNENDTLQLFHYLLLFQRIWHHLGSLLYMDFPDLHCLKYHILKNLHKLHYF